MKVKEMLEKLDAQEEKERSTITKKFADKRSSILKNYTFCGDIDKWGHQRFNDHFDFSSNKVIKRAKKNCDDWVENKNFAYVDIECCELQNYSYDCGYGDYDEFAIYHIINHYKVCKLCGNMQLIECEKVEREDICIPDHSTPWCRMDSSEVIAKSIREFKKHMNRKLKTKVFKESDVSSTEFRDKPIKITVRKSKYIKRK